MGPSPRHKGVHKDILDKGVPIPRQMRRLPVDPVTGFHVPWFVAWIEHANGALRPDFRVIRPAAQLDAYVGKRCWLCGQPLGEIRAFVIGPMCSINRISSEPASHGSCARYAVKVCPFLVTPARKRNTKDLPEGISDPAGRHDPGNPGAMALWYSKENATILEMSDEEGGGWLYILPEPEKVEWYAKGALITEGEAFAPFIEGARKLCMAMLMEPPPSPEAVAEFSRLLVRAIKVCFPKDGPSLVKTLDEQADLAAQ